MAGMTTYHSIDLAALRALPPADRYQELRKIRQAVDAALTPESRAAAAEVLAEERARHGPGAPTRAAKRLGITPGRLTQILRKEDR